jgi:hypothetical protein
MRRFIRIALIAGVLLAMAAGAWWAARLMLGPASLQAGITAIVERPAQAWIRYLLRRLEGHPKLEAVLVPLLRTAQAQVEREPPFTPLPSFGKGQRDKSLMPAVRGTGRTLEVDTPQAIREALLKAEAGTQILVAPGVYPFRQNLHLRYHGHSDAPIVLRAAEPGTVWFEFAQTNGIVVDRPYWVFENLRIRGVCKHHDDCEHAFHVVGRGSDVLIRNNHLSDFNAHVKVNGLNGQWPDRGRLLHNTLTNRSPRETTRSVTPLDLVGANHWHVADNHITNFVKAWGNQVAYGMFMKGGSNGGRFERNLVVCTPQGISQPGVRIGLSFGGGGTGASYCRVDGCGEQEHTDGIAANNIIAHCNDVGLDVNRSARIDLVHNTLINTSGIASRGGGAQARAFANLYEGRLVAHDGSSIQGRDNSREDASRLYVDPDGLDFSRLSPEPTTGYRSSDSDLDFNGAPRPAEAPIGALR